MIFDEILASDTYLEMSAEERGCVLDLFMRNVVSGGEGVTPESDGQEEKILTIAKKFPDLIELQLDTKTFCDKYVVQWAVDYSNDLKKAGITSSGSGRKNKGILEREKNQLATVGYQKLSSSYCGLFPTSRYETRKEVFVLSQDQKKQIEYDLGRCDITELLEELYFTLYYDKYQRVAAHKMPALIHRYVRGHAKREVTLEQIEDALRDD